MELTPQDPIPRLLSVGIIAMSSRDQLIEESYKPLTSYMFELLSTNDLVRFQIDLEAFYYGVTKQYRIPEPIEEAKIIARSLARYTRDDARAAHFYNFGVKGKNLSYLEKATKIAPHVGIVWMEFAKLAEEKGDWKKLKEALIGYARVKKVEENPLIFLAYLKKEFPKKLKSWRKGNEFKYLSQEKGILLQLIEQTFLISSYINGNAVSLAKKEMLVILEDIQVVLEWISLLSSLSYFIMTGDLVDSKIITNVIELLETMMGFKPSELGELQIPNFLNPTFRKENWIRKYSAHVVSVREIVSIRDAEYVHGDGDLGNDDPETHLWRAKRLVK